MAALMASARMACSGRYSEVTLPAFPARPVLPTCTDNQHFLSMHPLKASETPLHSSAQTGQHKQAFSAAIVHLEPWIADKLAFQGTLGFSKEKQRPSGSPYNF